jgi:hypothetical protein
VDFTAETDETEELVIEDLEEGDTCSFTIKSKCNSPAFRVADSENMDDSNVEVSFIEYEKKYVNATSTDSYDSSESKESRKTKMPSDDKPPRNTEYGDMGSMNKTCESEWSVSLDTNIEAREAFLDEGFIMKVIEEDNSTYTIHTCERGQFKPKRKYKKDDSETEETDMKKEYKSMRDSVKTTSTKKAVDVDYIDAEGSSVLS